MAEDLDLSIIIVNWNVRDLLRDCLQSLRREMRLPRDRYETIVVDNASADGSVEMLRSEFPDVQLIVSDANLGFAGGCEAGYAIARGRRILLLNPDTVVLDQAIDRMMAEMDARPDAGVIGSRLLNSDGSFQRAAGGAFPSLANVAWNYLFLDRLLPFRRAPSPVFMRDDDPGVIDIDWVSGAAMLIRREVIGERIFDPHYFMFGEDMDLCDRVRRAGWRVLYSGRQSIVHHHGRSFSAQSSLEVLANVYKGPRRFFQLRHPPAAVLVYDVVVLTGYLIRWPLFRLLAMAKPGGSYDEMARFSRRYVWIMFQLMLGPRRQPAKPAQPVASRPRPPPGPDEPTAARGVSPPETAGARAETSGEGGRAPRFSVIMNVYNGEAYLPDAIESVLAQTFADWELIIWDDCSTDGSPEVCARYQDSRIRRVRSPERVSIAEARNHAIGQARGEWVAFLDQDDIWSPGKLAAQNALIEAGDDRLGLVYGRALRFDRRGRRWPFDTWYGPRPLPEGDIFATLMQQPSFIALSSVAIRRSALDSIGPIPPDVVYCPDYYLTLHVARRWRAACLQALCCLYRVHGTNMSYVYRRQIHQEILHIVETAAPDEHQILQRRRRVHETWIGVEEIRGGDGVWAGLSRILRSGSVAYLTLRPLLLLGRSIRHRAMRHR